MKLIHHVAFGSVQYGKAEHHHLIFLGVKRPRTSSDPSGRGDDSDIDGDLLSEEDLSGYDSDSDAEVSVGTKASQKAFCCSCHAAVSRGLINLNKKAAFVTKGFSNWKEAKQRFKEHEHCQMHREACMKLQSCQRPSVAAQLSHQLLIDQKHRLEMLIKVFFCSRV